MYLDKVKGNSLYIGLCLLLFVCFSFIYSRYFFKDPILRRDDVLLVLPLKDVVNLSGYLDSIKTNAIPDIQPVRDLSFYFNIKIFDWTGYSTFRYTNLAIFIFSVFLLMKLLEALNFPRKHIVGSGLLYAAHPIMVSSVGWISARKHDLALVFILLCLLEFIKQKKLTKWSSTFYILSILSHQIAILLPVWIFIYFKGKKLKIDRANFIVMCCSGLSILCVAIMKTFYLGMGNVSHRYYTHFENISRYVLSIGRSLAQVFFPISISTDYFQGSVLNLVGLPILVLLFFVYYKSKNREDALLWLSLSAFSHILTCIAFINDTYLYLPLICVIISINFYFFNNPLPIHKHLKSFLIAVCFILLGAKTISASQMWKSDKDLWQYSYSNERSPFTSILLGTYLIPYNEKVALDFIIWGAKNYDINSHGQIFFAYLDVIYKSSIPIQQKIKILGDTLRDHEVYQAVYALALLEGTNEQMDLGVRILKQLLKAENTYVTGSHGLIVIKSIRYLCLNFPGKDRACKELNITY